MLITMLLSSPNVWAQVLAILLLVFGIPIILGIAFVICWFIKEIVESFGSEPNYF